MEHSSMVVNCPRNSGIAWFTAAKSVTYLTLSATSIQIPILYPTHWVTLVVNHYILRWNPPKDGLETQLTELRGFLTPSQI